MITRMLRRWLGVRPVVVRAKRVPDAVMLETLAVPEDHAILQTMLELVDRQRESVRADAKACEGDPVRMGFYLGGEAALDAFEGFLLTVRSEGLRDAERRARLDAAVKAKTEG